MRPDLQVTSTFWLWCHPGLLVQNATDHPVQYVPQLLGPNTSCLADKTMSRCATRLDHTHLPDLCALYIQLLA